MPDPIPTPTPDITPDTTPPDDPGNLVLSAGNGTVMLSWTEVTDAESYRVYRDGMLLETDTPITTTTYTDSDPINDIAYRYTVRAVDAAGNESGDSNEESATPGTPPDAPTGLSAAIVDGAVMLSWNPVAAAASYRIYRDGMLLPTDEPVTTITYTDSTAVSSTTYMYIVRAVDAFSRESGNSNEESATPTLPAPRSLILTAGDTEVMLSWTEVIGAISYRIYRDGMLLPTDETITDTTYTDSTTSSGTEYSYTVRAVDVAGNEGSASDSMSATTGTSPDIPTGLSSTLIDGEIMLSWNPVTAAASYRIYRDGMLLPTDEPVTATTYTDSTAVIGTTYMYTVRTVDAFSRESGDSLPITAFPTLPAPGGLTLTAGDTEVMLSWTEVIGAISYRIYRDGMLLPTDEPITAATYTDSTASSDTEYSYTVRAVDAAGNEGSVSDPMSATTGTPPDAPGGLVIGPVGGEINFIWRDVTNAVSYRIYRDGMLLPTDEPVTDTTYTDNTAVIGTTYMYTVRAVDVFSRESPNSNVLTLTRPLPAPVGFIFAVEDTGVRLSWNPVAGAISYRVYRDDVLHQSDITTTTYLDTAVTLGETYLYIVVALDINSLQGGFSLPIRVTPAALPDAPDNLMVDVVPGEVTLTWNGATGATSYRVTRDPAFPAGTFTNTSDLAFRDFNVTAGATYTYTVRAVNTNNREGGNSLPITATLPPPAPALMFTAGDTTVTLTWNEVTAAASYRVYRNDMLLIMGLTALTHTDTTVTNGETYTYTVRAVDMNDRESGDSNEVLITPTPRPDAPDNLRATASIGDVMLSWDPGIANTYSVYRDGELIAEGITTVTSYTDDTVNSGTDYTYTVRAVDLNGNESDDSDPVSVSTPLIVDFENLDNAGNESAFGIWSDETIMWVSNNPLGGSNKKIFAYNLSDESRNEGEDFDTLFEAGNTEPQGIWSKNNIMWVVDSEDTKLYAYNLTSKARVPDEDFDLVDENTHPFGIWSNDTTMWVSDTVDAKLYAYNLTSKERVPAQDFDLAEGNARSQGIWSDGTTMWVLNNVTFASSGDKIFAYNLIGGARVPAQDFDTLLAAGNTDAFGIWSDGATMWVVDPSDNRIYTYGLASKTLIP